MSCNKCKGCDNCPNAERVDVLFRLAQHLTDELAQAQRIIDTALNDAGDVLYGTPDER